MMDDANISPMEDIDRTMQNEAKSFEMIRSKQTIQRKRSLFWIRLYLAFYAVGFLLVRLKYTPADLSASLGNAEAIVRTLPLAGMALWIVAMACTPKRFWIFYIVFTSSLLVIYIALVGISDLELSWTRIGWILDDWFMIIKASILVCMLMSVFHYIVVIQNNKQAILEGDGTSKISRLFRIAENGTTER